MKTSFLPRLLLLGGIFTAVLTSCGSSGTDPGDTNVERASAKTQLNSNTSAGNAPDPRPYSVPDTGGQLYSVPDAAVNGIGTDTSTVKSGRRVYERTDEREDNNSDGRAD